MSSQGSNLPPSKASRSECWAARDHFFSCLDTHGLWLGGVGPGSHAEMLSVDPLTAPQVQEAAYKSSKALKNSKGKSLVECKREYLQYCQSCLPSWVDHFCKLRVKELQTRALAKSEQERERERTNNDSQFWANVRRKE